MIDWTAITTVLSVYVVGVVLPGPNFVAVAHKAASTTTREALPLVAGVVVVNASLFTLRKDPKSMAFYAAVFAAAAPKHVSSPTFIGMLVTVAIVAAAWYGIVAIVFATPSVAARYRRGKAWMDRVCGAMIVALGIRQLVR